MTSLLAAIQKVQVTNWPRSSHNVTVTNWPTPDPVAVSTVHAAWATFWVAIVALAVAVIGALYAKGAFETAEGDLEISKKNWEMVNRAPKLAAAFEVREPHETSVSTNAQGHRFVTYGVPRLTAIVANTADGKKRCDAFYIEVIVAVDALSLPEQARLTTEAHQGFVMKSQAIQGVTLFPGGGPVEVHFEFQLDYSTHAKTFDLQYRMVDDFNDYPKDGYLKVQVSIPNRAQQVFVNPRDEAEAQMLQILRAGHPANDDSGWYSKYIHAFELLDVGGFKTPSGLARVSWTP